MFGAGPATIDIENSSLQRECEIVRAEATRSPDGGIAFGTILLRGLGHNAVPLEYRVTWWDRHEHQLPTPREWIRLTLTGQRERTIFARPPPTQGALAERGTFELRYDSRSE